MLVRDVSGVNAGVDVLCGAGSIPKELGELYHLEELHLEKNRLSGESCVDQGGVAYSCLPCVVPRACPGWSDRRGCWDGTRTEDEVTATVWPCGRVGRLGVVCVVVGITEPHAFTGS